MQDEKDKIEKAIDEGNVEALNTLFSKSNIDVNADLGVRTNDVQYMRAQMNLKILNQ